MSPLPKGVRTGVSRVILQRAVEIGWDDLTLAERSRTYEAWMDDPEIGGQITQYLPRERARVWIKDGPMKEYSRAKRGLGPYAGFLAYESPRIEQKLTLQLYGTEWTVVEGSVLVKPARYTATNGNENVQVIWGSWRDLKHLVWAWLNVSSSVECRIVLVDTVRYPITSDVVISCRRIAGRLNTTISIVQV